MKNLYIDFDGVILDTINVTYDMINELKLDTEDMEQMREFYTTLDWKELLKNTPQINDSIACIQKIIDSNLFNVSILSHIFSMEEAVEKVKYIRKYFKDITIIPVPKIISKTKMVHTEGSILIDDFSGNLREWEAAGGIGVRFSLKRSSKGFHVIDKLDQVIDMFAPETIPQ